MGRSVTSSLTGKKRKGNDNEGKNERENGTKAGTGGKRGNNGSW